MKERSNIIMSCTLATGLNNWTITWSSVPESIDMVSYIKGNDDKEGKGLPYFEIRFGLQDQDVEFGRWI